MLRALRDQKREEGFTLIELMVVVLIIAILIAIAVPTFLGARQRAQDRAAQSDLRNALTAAKTIYADTESYDTDATTLEGVEPSLTYVANTDGMTAAEVDPDEVHFNDSADSIVFVTESDSGTFFCIAEVESTGTWYDSGSDPASLDTVAECNAGQNGW